MDFSKNSKSILEELDMNIWKKALLSSLVGVSLLTTACSTQKQASVKQESNIPKVTKKTTVVF